MRLQIKNPTGSLRAMASQRFFQVAWVVSLGFILLSVGLIFWQLFPEVTEQIAVPLHYNIHFGVDLFGAWTRIFTVPVTGAIIFLVNSLVAIFIYKREKTLSFFFMGVNVIAQVLLFIAMVFIVLLNLSYYG